MKKLLPCLLLVLAGCASSPKQVSAPYCYTNQDIRVQNGERVNSETRLQCSDNPVDRMAIRNYGISPDCGEYKYLMTIQGRTVERRGYACQKLDGTYEVVPHPSMYQR
ncbi:hypothetical protein EB118_09405 [bacterium]|nr:hypothetical protein [bacterium]